MNAVTESEAREPSQERHEEAKNRLAQIIESIESRFEGQEMANIIHYELQEIRAGRLSPEKAQVIDEKDFRTILYTDNLSKDEIRRIVWGILLRARKVLDASQKKARETKLAARR